MILVDGFEWDSLAVEASDAFCFFDCGPIYVDPGDTGLSMKLRSVSSNLVPAFYEVAEISFSNSLYASLLLLPRNFAGALCKPYQLSMTVSMTVSM